MKLPGIAPSVNNRLYVAAALALLAVGAACLAPHILNLYHIEAGGRVLAAAEAGDEAARARLTQALAHFAAALDWEPEDAQAYRLLGRAYLAADNPEAAIPPLTRFTELRPDHPLGYWELSLAHEAIWRRWAELIYNDLAWEAPLAQIEAPNQAGELPFCRVDDLSEGCYLASGIQEVAGREEQVLLQRAPSRVTYQLDLPTRPAVLRVRPGHAMTGEESSRADLDLAVLVETAEGGLQDRLYQASLPAEVALGEQVRLDLARYVGEEVKLIFVADAGTSREGAGDWVMWVAPVVEGADAARWEPAGRAAKMAMMRAWMTGGFTAQDFLDAGEAAQTAGIYLEALGWYDRVLLLEQDLPQAWLGKALAHQAQGEWDQAAKDFAIAFQQDPALKPQLILPSNQDQLLSLESFEGVGNDPVVLTDWQGQQVIAFLRNYTLTATILVEEVASHQVRVSAVNSQPGPVELAVGIDGVQLEFLRFDKNDWSWEEKRVCLTLPFGFHSFSISFTNDSFVDPGSDRNALVGEITFLASREAQQQCEN